MIGLLDKENYKMSTNLSSRMISGEVVVSLFALAYAWSGGIAWPLEPGYFFIAIHARDGLIGNVIWALLLGVPALILAAAGVREWVCSGQWSMQQIRASSILRGRLVVTQGVSWLYGLWVASNALSGVQGGKASALVMHTVMGTAFCVWSYLENRRVKRATTRRTIDPGVVGA